MTTESKAGGLNGVEEVFKALGHPARVMIVRRLSEREHCVCDLVDAVGLGWSTVSRHLSILKGAGIVRDEKRGLQVYYHLVLPCVSRFIACLENPAEQPEWMLAPCRCG
ncbi:MAG: metalloregulator ArsR/SmtB family transcription factor [Oceanipulchritudo sp.]